MTKAYTVIVTDPKGRNEKHVIMVTKGLTLEQALKSAQNRFGVERVRGIHPCR